MVFKICIDRLKKSPEVVGGKKSKNSTLFTKKEKCTAYNRTKKASVCTPYVLQQNETH